MPILVVLQGLVDGYATTRRIKKLKRRRAITPLTMIVAQKPAQSLAATAPPLAAAVHIRGNSRMLPLPLVIPLRMEMVDVFAQRPPQRALAEEDHLGQELLLDRLTQRSAWAFRFGLRAGSARGSTRPDIRVARNYRVNFVSRSCRRYLESRSAPRSSMVAFRATCFIHASSG